MVGHCVLTHAVGQGKHPFRLWVINLQYCSLRERGVCMLVDQSLCVSVRACVCVMMAGQMPYCLSVELFAWCWAQWAWPSDPAARTRDVSRLPKESTLIFMLWVFAVLQLVMKHAHTHTHTLSNVHFYSHAHTLHLNTASESLSPSGDQPIQ